MSAVIIVDGRVTIRPESVDATLSLLGVDTGGASGAMDMKTKGGKLINVMCLKKAGAASTFKLQLFDSSSLSLESLVYEVETINSADTRIHMNPQMVGFNNSANNNLYAKVTPGTGSGHEFFVRVQAEMTKKL